MIPATTDPSAASRCMLTCSRQPDSGGDRSCRSLCSGCFLDVFCTSRADRQSHKGKPGCCYSEEEHCSQLHQAVYVYPCYLGGTLSSWSYRCSISDASGSATRIEIACIGSVSFQRSPRYDVQLVERGRQNSHIASMLSSGCHLYRCCRGLVPGFCGFVSSG